MLAHLTASGLEAGPHRSNAVEPTSTALGKPAGLAGSTMVVPPESPAPIAARGNAARTDSAARAAADNAASDNDAAGPPIAPTGRAQPLPQPSQQQRVVPSVSAAPAAPVVSSSTSTTVGGLRPSSSASSMPPLAVAAGPSPSPQQPPNRLEVIGPLGQGVSGMVLLAMDHGRDGTQRRQVAVKRVPLSAKAPGGEWGLMRDLAHPNLLRALDFLPEGTLGFGGAPGPAAAGAEGGEAPAAPSNRQSLLNAVLGGGVGGRAAAGGKTGLLLLEYAPGGPAHRVADAAKALPMPAREAFASSVIRHVLLALAYLHSSRIVHRDVKGANILLFPNTLVSTGGGGTPFSPPPRTAPVAASLSPLEAATFPVGPAQPAPLAKLGDLGVAVRVAAAPDAGSAAGSHAGGGAQPPIAGAGANNNDVAGSVFWMPPEGIRGDVTPAFDIWSCGCTAFELVNGGKPPLHDREWANAMFTILHVVDSGANSLVQLLKDDTSGEILRGENAVSASFLDFLKAALTVDARQRPTATELLRHAWITDHESSMLPFNFPLPSAQGPSGSASTTAPAAVPLPSVQQNGVPHLRRASDNLTALTLEQVISVCAAGSAIAAAAWLEPDMPAPGAGAGDGAHMAPLHAMKRARAKSQARVRDFVKGIEQRADALRTSNVSIASVASVFDALPAPRDDCESAILLDAGLAPSPAAAAAVRDRLTIARALYALAHVVDPQRAVSQHNPQQLQPAAAGSSGTAIANLLADLAAGGFWSTDWDAVFPPPLVALGIARANMGAAIGLGNSLDQALLEGAEARRGYRAIWDDVALALCVLYGASCAHTLLHPPRFACASEGALRLLLASDAHRADALRALLRGVETLANTAPVIARDGDIDAALMASAGGVAEVRAIALSLRRTLPLLCEGAAAALLRAGPDEMRAETARATLDLGAVALLRIAAEGASSDVLLEVLQKDVLWRSLQTALPPRRVAVHVVDLAVRAAHLLPVRELLDRRMLMPTLLQLASAPLSYERSTDLAEVLAHCREHAPQALVGLASQQGVIAHLINVPVPAGCAPTLPVRMIAALTAICCDPALARVYAGTSQVRNSAVSRLRDAVVMRRNDDEIVQCIALLSGLFAHAATPDDFAAHTELQRLLVSMIQRRRTHRADVAQAASALLDGIIAAITF